MLFCECYSFTIAAWKRRSALRMAFDAERIAYHVAAKWIRSALLLLQVNLIACGLGQPAYMHLFSLACLPGAHTKRCVSCGTFLIFFAIVISICHIHLLATSIPMRALPAGMSAGRHLRAVRRFVSAIRAELRRPLHLLPRGKHLHLHQ